MGLTYEQSTGDFKTFTTTLIGDGSSTSINIPLSTVPFNLDLSSHQPSSISLPIAIAFGSPFYNVSKSYNATTSVLTITLAPQGGSPAAPPLGSTAVITGTFIYPGV